jgi:hypothetical protein
VEKISQIGFPAVRCPNFQSERTKFPLGYCAIFPAALVQTPRPRRFVPGLPGLKRVFVDFTLQVINRDKISQGFAADAGEISRYEAAISAKNFPPGKESSGIVRRHRQCYRSDEDRAPRHQAASRHPDIITLRYTCQVMLLPTIQRGSL